MINRLRNEGRRKELGKMLMDIAKYLATVGLLGGLLSSGITFYTGLSIIVAVLILAAVGFYAIPPKLEAQR